MEINLATLVAALLLFCGRIEVSVECKHCHIRPIAVLLTCDTVRGAVDGISAAISNEGQLYTWGDGAAGALGYPDAIRQLIPRPVMGALQDKVIVQVGSVPNAKQLWYA